MCIMALFFPGNSGDFESCIEGRASGGLIIDEEIVIDPGTGFVVKSRKLNPQTVVVSCDDPLFNNDLKILIERFKPKESSPEIKTIGEKTRSFIITAQKYILGYIAKAELTKKFA